MTYNDLGRWANMRLTFIKQHRPQLYQSLLKENKLNSYLAEFERQVRDTLILTEEQLRQAGGITEELKRKDQLEWVRRMNNISSRAEEIVMAELVYE
ncbi:TnpV protein [Gemmiger sp.]